MCKKLEAIAQNILQALQISGCSLEIFLVSDRIMRDINREYRGKDEPTNVLSFNAAKIPRPENKIRHLGEIYLAPKYISSHNEDIQYLLLHGILHLVGYEHEKSNSSACRMQKKEKEIIQKITNGL